MLVEEMNAETVNDVAILYINLVDFMKKETEDAYFNYNSVNKNHFSDWLHSTLADNQQVTYLAKIDNEVVGFISGEVKDCFLPISKVEKVGYIKGAYVREDYRKQGIMDKLEEEIVNFFDRRELSFVELNVISNNFIGEKAWKALGYTTFRKQMRKRI